MQSRWIQTSITVDNAIADDLGALLLEEGAAGIHHNLLGGATELIITFDADTPHTDIQHCLNTACSDLGLPEPQISITEHEDEDWAHRWKEHFKPLQLGQRVFIVPSWEQSFTPPEHSIILNIDPGLAFGTGQHATTALCVAALEELYQHKQPKTVLDLGCGTGILGMVALKLGASHVWAIDNDPIAVSCTQENMTINHLEHQCTATAEDVSTLTQRFDVVVANILAVTLIELVHVIVPTLQTNGHLILSGILDTQADDVITAYEDAFKEQGLEHVQFLRKRQEQDWVALEFGYELSHNL